MRCPVRLAVNSRIRCPQHCPTRITGTCQESLLWMQSMSGTLAEVVCCVLWHRNVQELRDSSTADVCVHFRVPPPFRIRHASRDGRLGRVAPTTATGRSRVKLTCSILRPQFDVSEDIESLNGTRHGRPLVNDLQRARRNLRGKTSGDQAEPAVYPTRGQVCDSFDKVLPHSRDDYIPGVPHPVSQPTLKTHL